MFATSTIGACAADDQAPGEPAGDGVVQVQSALGTVQPFGLIFQSGMRIDFSLINNPTGLNPLSVTGLTACEPKVLYAVMPDADSTFSLYFSSDGGLSFVKSRARRSGVDVPAAAKSAEIACDDGRLFTIGNTTGGKKVFFADRSNGNLIIQNPSSSDPWNQSAATPSVDHIQGSDGTIYGVQGDGPGLHPLYKANTHIGGADLTWTFVEQVGSKYVTGGGSSNVSDRLAWPRRAFSNAPDGTVAFNDTILDGQNIWPGLNTGSERFSVLTAGMTNFLYGIDTSTNPGLVTIKITEDNCTDGVDNDADGRVDSEDPACAETAAMAFCALPSTLNGTYCVDRYQPAFFLGQQNQNAGLVTCNSSHQVVPPGGAGTPKVPRPGACVRVGTRSDRLMTAAELAGSDPANTGRWCNMIWPSTQRWDFAWGGAGSDPCTTIRNRNVPGGVVVRAGLFTTTGANVVQANCNGGSSMAGAVGTAPLQAVFNAVGHTTNACIFKVAPTAMPVFSQPFPLSQQGAGASLHFNHTFSTVDVAQFGHGETGTTQDIDRDGFKFAGSREHAYDIALSEGVPLYAMRAGTIPASGSRDRDVTWAGCATSYQGEIYVKHVIGSSSTYQDSYVAFYGHPRRSLVVDGQSVRAGQLVGFSGRNGCSGGPHLHMHMFRERNVNARKVGQPEFGYRANLVIDSGTVGNNFLNTTAIDPFGWGNQVAYDPNSYLDADTDTGQGWIGFGGLSVDLFIPGQRPHL
jgi:murein DD-endopeptidase MepM/ murein hydrolase activator NlpD